MSFIIKIACAIYICNNHPSKIFSYDSHEYLASAETILHNHSFQVSVENPDPETFRTPGYPLFIAIIYSIFGESTLALLIFNVLFNTASAALIYVIVRKIYGFIVGISAVILYLSDFTTNYYLFRIITEPIFTFALILALYLILLILEGGGNTYKYFAVGIILSAAVMIRPAVYNLVLPVIIILIISQYRKHTITQIIKFNTALVIPVLVIIGGWHYRNYVTTGYPIFTSLSGYNLLFFNGAGVMSEEEGIDFYEAQYRLGCDAEGGRKHNGARYRSLHPETSAYSWEKLSLVWSHEGINIIRTYPFVFLYSHLKGCLIFFIDLPGMKYYYEIKGNIFQKTIELFSKYRLIFLFLSVEIIYLLLMYIGLMKYLYDKSTLRQFTVFDTLLIIILLYFCLMSGGPVAYFRLRIPVMPIITIMGAAGLYNIVTRRNSEFKNS